MTAFLILFRRRYDKAEAEFVACKLALHAAQDKKESMTEHLCLIIQKTEERKAEKLEKLMRDLEIGEEENSVVTPKNWVALVYSSSYSKAVNATKKSDHDL